MPLDAAALESELAALGLPHAAATAHAQHVSVPEGRAPAGLEQWRLKRGVLLDITCLPDVRPLSRRERELCSAERFLPAQYLALKADVAAQQAQRGSVSRADVQALPYLVDLARADRLHAFFVEMGCVTAPPPGAG